MLPSSKILILLSLWRSADGCSNVHLNMGKYNWANVSLNCPKEKYETGLICSESNFNDATRYRNQRIFQKKKILEIISSLKRLRQRFNASWTSDEHMLDKVHLAQWHVWTGEMEKRKNQMGNSYKHKEIDRKQICTQMWIEKKTYRKQLARNV